MICSPFSGANCPADDIALAETLSVACQQPEPPARTAEAEPLLRECLTIREKRLPDDWLTFSTRSVLGVCLLSGKKYAEAEPLLLSGYNEMKARESKIPPYARPRVGRGWRTDRSALQGMGSAREGRGMAGEVGASRCQEGQVKALMRPAALAVATWLVAVACPPGGALVSQAGQLRVPGRLLLRRQRSAGRSSGRRPLRGPQTQTGGPRPARGEPRGHWRRGRRDERSRGAGAWAGGFSAG